MMTLLFGLTALVVYGTGFWTTFFIFARKRGFFGRLLTSAFWPVMLAMSALGIV